METHFREILDFIAVLVELLRTSLPLLCPDFLISPNVSPEVPWWGGLRALPRPHTLLCLFTQDSVFGTPMSDEARL